MRDDGGVDRVDHVPAGLALVEGGAGACQTAGLAGVAGVVGGVGVGGRGAGLNAELVLEEESDACRSEKTAGAVRRETDTGVAIRVAEQAGVLEGHLVLSCRAGKGTIGGPVDQIEGLVVVVLALGAGGVGASEAERTASQAALADVAGGLSVVAVWAAEQALVVEVEVGHSADVGAGLAVDPGRVAGQAGCGAVLAGEQEGVLVLSRGAILGAGVHINHLVITNICRDLAFAAGVSAPAGAELATRCALGAPIRGAVGVVVVGAPREAAAVDPVVVVARVAVPDSAVGRQP